MAKKFLLGLFLLTLTAHGTPLESFLENHAKLSGPLKKMDGILAAQIKRLDGLATKMRPRDKLKAPDQGKLLGPLGELRSQANIGEFEIGRIKGAFKDESPHSGPSDKAASIAATFGAIDRDIRRLTLELREAGINDVLGDLREIQFVVNNTAANLILLLAAAVEMSPPDTAQTAQIGKLVPALLKTFRASARRIEATPEKAMGDRLISYVKGNTLGSISDQGPSALLASQATAFERELISELKAELTSLSKGKSEVIRKAGLFVDCAGAI